MIQAIKAILELPLLILFPVVFIWTGLLKKLRVIKLLSKNDVVE